jgi:hypothetical protein
MDRTPGGKEVVAKDGKFLGLTWIRPQEQPQEQPQEKEHIPEEHLLEKKEGKAHELTHVVVQTALQLRKQYLEGDKCVFNFRFSMTTLEYLYAFLRNEVAEVGGVFQIDYYRDEPVGRVAFLTMPVSRVVRGKGEPEYTVDFGPSIKEDTIGVFHTHPNIIVMQEGVFIAWPSAVDILVQFELYITRHVLFHFVSTTEGIYTIALSAPFILFLQGWAGKVKGIRPHCMPYLNKALEAHFGKWEGLRSELTVRKTSGTTRPTYDETKNRYLYTSLTPEEIERIHAIEKKKRDEYITEYFRDLANYSIHDLGREISSIIRDNAPTHEVPGLLACFAEAASDSNFPLFQSSFRSWQDIYTLKSFLGQILLPKGQCDLSPPIKFEGETYI